MARDIGISKSTLAKMGHDENVSLEVICRICAYLDCSVEDVMEIKYVR
jgi:DNA-binding Xre family transcriptional regulator